MKGVSIMNDENRFENEVEQTTDEAQPTVEVQPTGESQPRYDYDYSQPIMEDVAPKKEKKGFNFGKVVLVAVMAIMFGVLAAVVFQGTNMIINRYFGKSAPSTVTDSKLNTTQIATGTGEAVSSNIADVAANVMPSVVSITNLSIQEVQSFFFGGVQQYESQSSGSGIIIGQNDKEVLMVTNNHVVEGSKTLTVTFIDGTSIDAQIKGTDSDKDLAIISIPLASLESKTKEAIKVATLGDSKVLRVGEPTIAIGNALGYGQSVTTGIVSALGRTIEDIDVALIQTDAAINPGNSGGALLNAKGEVIGINTAKVNANAVEGMGYAIPISDVTDILDDLINQKTRIKVAESERGALGISCLDVSSELSQYYNMPEGVYVKDVEKNSGADKAGLPLNSIITKIEGRSVDTTEELVEELQYYRQGETVKVTYYVQKDGKYVEKSLDIKLQ